MGFTSVVLLLWLLPSVAAGESSRDSAEALLRRVIDRQEETHLRQREYAYRERISTQHLRKDGSTRRAESTTFLVTPGPGWEYRRLVSRNGGPLDAKDEAEQEKRLKDYLEELDELPESERRARIEERLHNRVEKYQNRLREALEVFDFTPLDDDLVDGESVRVFRFAPKEGYKGRSRETKVLARTEGRVWIDPRHDQLAKLHIVLRDDVSFLAGIFGRISKGSEATAQASLLDGLWLLDRVDVYLNARFYFLKGYHERRVYDYHDYRKFVATKEERTETEPHR